MKLKPLGKSNINISVLGFGAWGIGGLTPGNTSYGSTNDSDSLKTLLFAYDSGVNFYDTANVYGNGNSENLIGKAFKKNRDKVVIATKCGMIDMNGSKDYCISSLQTSIFNSLKRLDTDYIDLIQLHDPQISIANDCNLLEMLDKLKSNGIIRSIGVSVKNPIDGLSFLDSNWDSIQCNLNLLDLRAVTCGLIEEASKHNISIIARTPLAFGFLSGNYYNKPLIFPPGDHRSRWSNDQLRFWADSPSHFLNILNKNNRDMLSLAIKFCSYFDSVSTVIPGMLSISEVKSNISAILSPNLTFEEYLEVININKKYSLIKIQ